MAINYPKLRKDLETERKKVQGEVEKAKDDLEKAKEKTSLCVSKLAELRARNSQLKTLQDNLPIEAYQEETTSKPKTIVEAGLPKETVVNVNIEAGAAEEKEDESKTS